MCLLVKIHVVYFQYMHIVLAIYVSHLSLCSILCNRNCISDRIIFLSLEFI